MHQPSYFMSIRERASARWDQLEGDPELAGPWRQLFRQVQSPGHVLSELLQNADDAGATEATAEIVNGEFVFSHNGEDFDEEQFASLCRFGFSNKRNLHTIGFRGVGFKSTFSLGDEVRLTTPTLSVAFHKQRFTEPEWVHSSAVTLGRTEVRVGIQNEGVEGELRRNLEVWGESSASLLFLNSIRCLSVGGQEIQWESQGIGPIDGSEWMSVSSAPDSRYLIIRSPEEEFPKDALREIRDERMSDGEETIFPPCRVEIVLGMEGRLFVVLPTGVTTQLPFACNAPFIQDPARLKIKDTSLSPTNRWLLRRVGHLAADAMLAWIQDGALDIEDRCKAYELYPMVTHPVTSIEGSCETIVADAFALRIDGERFLLSESDHLELSGNCLAVPNDLLDIWSPHQVRSTFSEDDQLILSRHVSSANQRKLTRLKHIQRLTTPQILTTLRNAPSPRPDTWQKLLRLWAYLFTEVDSWFLGVPSHLHILPVAGGSVLHSGNDVVRLGTRRNLSADEVDFITPFLRVLDQNWIDFLREQSRVGEASSDDGLTNSLTAAHSILLSLRLEESTAMDRILDMCARQLFRRSPVKIRDCVRLAHIAAKVGAAASASFRFVTQDKKLHIGRADPLIADTDGDLDTLVDKGWFISHVLHDTYANTSGTCADTEWREWVRSPRSGLSNFVPFTKTRFPISYDRDRLRTTLRQRGFQAEPQFRYRRAYFCIEDWDFEQRHWNHWRLLSERDPQFWCKLMTRILEQPVAYWSKAKTARALEEATNGRTRPITPDTLVPKWIYRFRSLPCLPDTYGRPHQPSELLLRTPETESLLDVELFVRSDLDTEAIKPLLRSMGVRDRPTGPEPLLERIQALAGTSTPLVPEVQKWCYRLDQLYDKCSTEETQQIKQAFSEESLILTEQDEWTCIDEVFLDPDEQGVPGAPLVHPTLRELTLWRKIGVAERPTVELAIGWLQGLRSGQKLTPAEVQRVRSLLGLYSDRIWRECGHWLNLEGEWTPIGNLSYSLTRQTLVSWSHLFPGVKARTANFQMFSSQVCQSSPYSTLSRLGDILEERPQEQLFDLPATQSKAWMSALGKGLGRVDLDNAEHNERVRLAANRLSRTRWQVADGLESTPYIDGTPAGTSRRLDVLWRDVILYVRNGHLAKLASKVPHEIGRVFGVDRVSEAIKMCYERDPSFIEAYLEENFRLASTDEVGVPSDEELNVVDQATNTGHTDGTGSDSKEDSLEIDDDTNVEAPVHVDDDERSSSGTARRRQNHRPSVIDRFAILSEFSASENGEFCHVNGSRIVRHYEEAFPWALHSPTGEILRRFWPKDHCLQQEPLQLGADVWRLCYETPDLYSLILTSLSGAPIEIRGHELIQMQQQGQVSLYPATYRLVYEGNGR